MEPSEAIATLRAFNAWRRCDEDSFQPDPRLIGQAIDELCDYVERIGSELEQERQDRKQADLDTIRALGERNDARAALMLAAQWGVSSDGFSAEVSSQIRCWIIAGMTSPPPKVPDYYPKQTPTDDQAGDPA